MITYKGVTAVKMGDVEMPLPGIDLVDANDLKWLKLVVKKLKRYIIHSGPFSLTEDEKGWRSRDPEIQRFLKDIGLDHIDQKETM